MRYKEFNRNNVLEKIIPLFWASGFNAVSVKAMVAATLVNRFSLYEEFENKEGILYSALELYVERYGRTAFDILDQDGSAAGILERFFLGDPGKPGHHRGCFMIHIGTELADSDEKVKALLKNYLGDLEKRLNHLLVKHGMTAAESAFKSRHLIGLFCTSKSFSLIQTEEERLHFIRNGVNMILNKDISHA